MNKKIETLNGPCGVKLILDPNEIDIDNPGNVTPLLVTWRNYTGSLDACLDTGYIEEFLLPVEVVNWLYDQFDYAYDWLEDAKYAR